MEEQRKQRDRIARELDMDNLDLILALLSEQLSGSDLNSLLMEVFRRRASADSPSDLLKRYRDNRFVKPATVDSLALKQLELDVLRIAQSYAFSPIQLSPVAPAGSCSVVAEADQNKIISALRGTEVVADVTNLLALHVADGLKTGGLDNRSSHVRFSTTHRHVRAQQFAKAPGTFPHFHLMAMVSSGVDVGSYGFEISTFWEHAKVYQAIFQILYQAEIEILISQRGGYKDAEGLIQRIRQYGEDHEIPIPTKLNPPQLDNPYYKGLQFTVIATIDGKVRHIGDGGFVDWTQQLLGNRKERYMISAIGLDRLLL